MSGKKILIVTYYWPPSGGVGVQRWLHFAINLKKMGWEPIVYTPENPQFEIQDENLEKLVADIQVIKQPIWEPFSFFHKLTRNKNRKGVQQGTVLEKPKKSLKDNIFIWVRGNFFIPDSRVFWVKRSVAFLKIFLLENEIETIVTTGPPHSMHLIGLKLKGAIPSLKWLADFRDPWSDWDLLDKLLTSKLTRYLHKYLEKRVVSSANTLTVTSKGTGLLFGEKYNITPEVIMNGVSKGNFEVEENRTSDKKFVIGYFGMLNELRNPTAFWQCLERFFLQNEALKSSLEIRISGITSESIIEELKTKYSFYSNINFLGYLSHAEVFKEYRKCNILLLLQNQTSNSKFLIPAKFFEYLTARKPILGIGVKPSDLQELFSNRSVGVFLTSDEKKEMIGFLQSNFESDYKINENDFTNLIAEYSREFQAERLSSLLKSMDVK